jgi:hypothetical protein
MTAPHLSFCPYCGSALLAPAQRFCASCGHEFPQRQAPDDAPVTATAGAMASASTDAGADIRVGATAERSPGAPVDGARDTTPATTTRTEEPEAVTAPTLAPAEAVPSMGPDGAGDLTTAPQAGQAPATPAAAVAHSVGPRGAGDWVELRALARAAVPVIGGWAALAALVGTLAAQTLTSDVTGQLLGSGPLSIFDASSLFGSLSQVIQGAAASLMGGLGYQLSGGASLGAGGLGASVSAIGSLSVVPLGAVLLLAALAGLGARRGLTEDGDAGWRAVAVRITVLATLASGAIYALASFDGSTFSAAGNPAGGLLGGTLSVTGGPMPDHLVVVLFPLLWLGAAWGMADRVAWERDLPPVAVRRVRRGSALARTALVGYLAALLGIAALFALALGSLALTGALGPDGGLVGLVPLVLTLLPNLAGLAIAAGSGAPVSLGGTNASVWQLGPLLALLGVAALALPGLLAGCFLVRRVRDASPIEVALVGFGAALTALVGAALAIPSVAASGSAGAYGTAATAGLGLDLGQAALVITIVVTLATYAGFLVATRAATTAPASTPVLEPAGASR